MDKKKKKALESKSSIQKCEICLNYESRSIFSFFIQEIVNLMYTPEQSPRPITTGMHIHPALSEVVSYALGNFQEV